VILSTRRIAIRAALFAGLVVSCGLGMSIASAADAVRVASNIVFDTTWSRYALPAQRRFITVLGSQQRPVSFDVFPYNRFRDALDGGLADCILASHPGTFKDTIASKSNLRFELRLFQRVGTDIRSLPQVDIGILANLPRPKLQLRGEIVWHDLSSLGQAVDLLAAGRLTGIIGDSTNIRMFGRADIVETDLPPVITVDIVLICRDTEPLREFVSSFDSSMGVIDSGKMPHGDLRHMVDNAW
jgi:hypothetical protein